MNRKCEFRKRDGQRCGADAQSGNALCVFHDPAKAAAGRRARGSGGINRSRGVTILPLEAPDNPLRNSHDVSVLLGESINQARRGQLDTRVADAVGYLASIPSGRATARSPGGTAAAAREDVGLETRVKIEHPTDESTRIRETNERAERMRGNFASLSCPDFPTTSSLRS